MAQLKIYHHKTLVTESSDDELEQIKKMCKIHYMRYNGTSRPIHEKTVNIFDYHDNSFPSGFIYQLSDLLPKIDFNAKDCRSNFVKNINLPFVRYDDNWESQNKFTEEISKEENNTGTIISPTGTGKSRLIEITIGIKRCNTLILCPSRADRDQLVENLAKAFGSSNVTNKIEKLQKNLKKVPFNKYQKKKAKDINDDLNEDADIENMSPEEKYFYKKGYVVKGNKHIKVSRTHDQIDKELKNIQWPKILVVCPQSLNNVPQEYFDEVGMFIVNEGHISSCETVRDCSNNLPNAVYRYSFTATAWRNRKEDMKLLFAVFGNKIIFEETYQESVEANKIKKVNYTQLNSPRPLEFLDEKMAPDEIIKRCIVGNKTRNDLLVETAHGRFINNRRVLICVTEEEHCKLLEEKFNLIDVPVHTYYGNQDKNIKNSIIRLAKDTNSEEGFIIIATYAFNIGIDSKAINTVFIGDLRKDSIKMIQAPGRGIRKTDFDDPDETLEIFDFNDWWNENTRTWASERKKVIKEYFESIGSYTKKIAQKYKINLF